MKVGAVNGHVCAQRLNAVEKCEPVLVCVHGKRKQQGFTDKPCLGCFGDAVRYLAPCALSGGAIAEICNDRLALTGGAARRPTAPHCRALQLTRRRCGGRARKITQPALSTNDK